MKRIGQRILTSQLTLLVITLCAGLAHGQDSDQPDYRELPVSHYVEQLQDDSFEIRRRAAYILGRIDAPADVAVPALAAALSDRQMETRWYAIDALGKFGAEAAPAVPAIIQSLTSTLNDETVRRRGARSLGRIGKAAEQAVPTLKAALESDDPLYRLAAADALWRIRHDQQALTMITSQLQAEDSQTAFFAAMTISELPDIPPEKVVPQLTAALESEDGDVRQAVVNAFVAIGPTAIEPLSEYLQQASSHGRADAARALGIIIDQQRKRVLHADVSEREFTAAAAGLMRIAFPAMASELTSNDASLRAACRLALAKGGSIAAFVLLKQLQADDDNTRQAAAETLVRMEAHLPKQRPLPDNLQRVHNRLVDPLITALASKSPITQSASVRLFVALQIGPVGGAARPHLQNALQSSDLATRRYADKALKQIENSN